ncbi:hypothetical protein CK203_085882 [Vitis vinifera]|uniref:Uncharacterized protein n=1 Tax=Vitis vinifera TaxID=29760 RepID=A0A438DI34_VITVI|nr:hypothetical protein CK203_085882 [Vitis vinifera]
MASNHRKKTVGKRTTTESSPPGDRKIKRRKRCITHPGFNIKASSSSAFKRPSSKLKAEPESIYPGTTGVIQKHATSQFSNSMRARLGPQEPGRPRPPVATTGATRPDPMVTPVVQNVLPHHDPMVTPVVRNVHSHPTVRLDGRNPSSEPPFGSISKKLDDMLSTPFCSHIIHYEPPRGFLVPKFSTYDGTSDPFDHIMHYRQLMTLDIDNDALLCKVFPASLLKDRPSHGFIAYLPTLLAISGTCPKLLWDNTCAPPDTSRTLALYKI